jgi:hypothetical protein
MVPLYFSLDLFFRSLCFRSLCFSFDLNVLAWMLEVAVAAMVDELRPQSLVW